MRTKPKALNSFINLNSFSNLKLFLNLKFLIDDSRRQACPHFLPTPFYFRLLFVRMSFDQVLILTIGGGD